MVPAMKFRVTGIARDGQRKSIPHDSQSLALRDAKQKKMQGWEMVEVEIWKDGTFQPEQKAVQALAKVASTKNNEDAEIALANLGAHTKTAYMAAKKNTLDNTMLEELAYECVKTLYASGMDEETFDDIVSNIKNKVGVHA